MADIPKPTGLDWVKLQEDMDQFGRMETNWDRVLRKFKGNPLVPFGTLITVGALSYGLYSFKKGHQLMQQKMMRLRVLAQMFTIFAAMGGIFLALPKEKRTLQGFIESGEKKIQ